MAPSPALLLVIAHPDDECMFFGPTLNALQRSGWPGSSSGLSSSPARSVVDVYVLCLTNGDADGLGRRRASELRHSCSVLGVPYTRVRLVDDARIRDGMGVVWDRSVGAGLVGEAVRAWGLLDDSDDSGLRIVTFDDYGVSGHANHRSVHAGVRWYCKGVGGVELWVLRSSWLVVKYMGCLSWVAEPCAWWVAAVLAWAGSAVMDVAAPETSRVCWNVDVRRVWRAMACHATQLTWWVLKSDRRALARPDSISHTRLLAHSLTRAARCSFARWRVLFVFLSQYSTLNRLVRVEN